MQFFKNKSKPKKIEFHFPYSDDLNIRRDQIWENLQQGILLENEQVFIPWETEYKNIDQYAQKRTDSGDRTVYYLGEQKILCGLTCHVEILKWSYQPNNSSFDQFSDNLGYDNDGYSRFLDRIRHLTELLGNPTKTELEKFGQFDIGSVEWVRNNVNISVVGFEIFNCRYSLNVGLIDNSHDRDLKNGIDKLKANGWTEEELGK